MQTTNEVQSESPGIYAVPEWAAKRHDLLNGLLVCPLDCVNRIEDQEISVDSIQACIDLTNYLDAAQSLVGSLNKADSHLVDDELSSYLVMCQCLALECSQQTVRRAASLNELHQRLNHVIRLTVVKEV